MRNKLELQKTPKQKININKKTKDILQKDFKGVE